jgi:glycosyltransferase involved in cell wall biosynthesis
LFPIWLKIQSTNFDLIHIADHSNSYYSFFCNPKKCIITCHDLLMMRAVHGDSTVGCVPSPIGFLLQRLIMAGLRHAGSVTFVSQSSLKDFESLGCGSPSQRHIVIPNSLNAPFEPDAAKVNLSTVEIGQLPAGPFLLMVGSNHPRKNRGLALQLIKQLGKQSPYWLVFAGDPLTTEEKEFRENHTRGDRLHSIVRPSQVFLNYLYCKAHALLFPSISEGFGWPLIEAQTCGCPVIASSTTSIPEVGGPAALYADPDDVETFAMHVLTLQDPVRRNHLIQLGYQNTMRFSSELVSESYQRFAIQNNHSQLNLSVN